jgi:protein TonB
MALVKLGTSAILGILVTFGLIVLMYTLIDSSDVEIDLEEPLKLPNVLHVERDPQPIPATEKIMPPAALTPPPERPAPKHEPLPKGVINPNPPPGPGSIVVEPSRRPDSEYIPVYTPQPKYPRRAQTRGMEGYAVVEVIVTTTGSVRTPVLIEEYPEGWSFGKASLHAATKLKYNPRVVDGIAREVGGVRYKFSFHMAE